MDIAVFDSCILIDHLRQVKAATDLIFTIPKRIISVVTEIELHVGSQYDAPIHSAERLLELFDIEVLDRSLALLAADARRDYRLKLPDAVIYATARRLGVPLVTRNSKDFPADMPGVVLPYQL
jgi:predicted nucleic acid-binding protein